MKPWRNPMSNKTSVATATVATVNANLFYNLNLEGSWEPSVIDLTQTNVRHATGRSIVRLTTHTTQQRQNDTAQCTDCIMDRILKKVELRKFITTALKSILKLVKFGHEMF